MDVWNNPEIGTLHVNDGVVINNCDNIEIHMDLSGDILMDILTDDFRKTFSEYLEAIDGEEVILPLIPIEVVEEELRRKGWELVEQSMEGVACIRKDLWEHPDYTDYLSIWYNDYKGRIKVIYSE